MRKKDEGNNPGQESGQGPGRTKNGISEMRQVVVGNAVETVPGAEILRDCERNRQYLDFGNIFLWPIPCKFVSGKVG